MTTRRTRETTTGAGSPSTESVTATRPCGSDAIRLLRHGRLSVALHALSDHASTDACPLLLLHALGSSTAAWRETLPRWPGPVYGLDFAGHGASDPLVGGGYYAEYFAANADLALAALGDRAAVAGSGIGAYVALLLAGARPDRVRAALLMEGEGLGGAGSMPDLEQPEVLALEQWESRIDADSASYLPGTDAMVSVSGHDFRPDDYVGEYASAARRLLLAGPRESDAATPAWWAIARQAPRAEVVPAEPIAAFARLAVACD